MPQTTPSSLPFPGSEFPTRGGHRTRTTAEQVADHCGLMIVEGRLAAGDRVGEEKLAEMFGISRGPVREAIRILERRRLVEILPRRGAFVREVTMASISDLFNVRNALSTMAAGTLARRAAAGEGQADTDRLVRRVEELRDLVARPECTPMEFSFQLTRFVFAVVRGSDNALLLDMWRDLNENTFWTTIWRVPQDGLTQDEREQRLAQVDRTLQAILAGEAPRAEAEIRTWLDDIRDRVLTNLRANRPSGIR